MCRSIKQLRSIEPEATPEDVQAAALQFVRKISGYRQPSQVNSRAFDKAVSDIAKISQKLLADLIVRGQPVR